MNALEALQTRTSAPRLTDPGPDPDQLDHICRAAMRAADHGLLRPWRFLLVKGTARERLGDLFVQAALLENPDLTEAQRQKLRAKPLRAPLIIAAVSSPKDHPKVPEFEQHLATAAAAQNMVTAAFALGVGAMWRTGSPAYQEAVAQGLGVADAEKIIGFLYLGTLAGPPKPTPDTAYDDYFQEW